MIRLAKFSFILLAAILSGCLVNKSGPQPSPTAYIFTQISESLDTPFTPTRTPTITLLSSPESTQSPTSDNPFLQEARALALKFDTYLQQESNWIHIVKETTSITQAGQVFPPPYMKSEEWFEVDSEGYAIRNVHTDYDNAGQIIQQAATVGDYGMNFTAGESGFNNSPRYRISIDILTDFLSRAIQENSSLISSEETTCANGKPCLIITGWQKFSAPVQNPGETQVYYGAGERVWIDLESGQLIERQAFWLLEDGSELASSTTNFTLVEKVSIPPQDILDILGRVIVP
jgi:hypothetical protein